MQSESSACSTTVAVPGTVGVPLSVAWPLPLDFKDNQLARPPGALIFRLPELGPDATTS